MALIECPECGRQISDRAKACPGCGIPQEDIRAILAEKASKAQTLEEKNSGVKEQDNKSEEMAHHTDIDSALKYLIQQGLISDNEYQLILRECSSVKENKAEQLLMITPEIVSKKEKSTEDYANNRIIKSNLIIKSKLIKCIACQKKYESTDDGICPYCHYPVFTLRGDKQQEKKAVVSYRKEKGFKIQTLNLKAGQQYTMGSYGGEKIQWKVLEVQEGKALLLSEKGLDSKPYHKKWKDITWAECDLQKWLNQEFINQAFTESEKKRIRITDVKNDDNRRYNTPGGENTKDQVLLLSIDEAERYFQSDEERICYPTEYAKKKGADVDKEGRCWWWLRSPGNGSSRAASVNYDGIVSEHGYGVNDDITVVRPALWINL